jgi:Chaperone of endosialidase/Head domain of trimeric autotransporter adhesin
MIFDYKGHPPTPFKGGFTISASPPLKGVGGCTSAIEILNKIILKDNYLIINSQQQNKLIKQENNPMKKQILILLTILLSGLSTTAQVGISATNTPPNASAMLDVSSTNKGLLPPRMSTAQRNAIASPADGLLVFDTNTQSYWYRRVGTWTELPQSTAAVNFWQQTGAGGNEIKNTNTGGFWSANPVGLSFIANNTSNPPTAPVSGAGTRMMWIPSRSAFRVGTVFGSEWDDNNIGLFSFASGVNTKANGDASIAIGESTIASGGSSTAMGVSTTASGSYSTAMGYGTYATGYVSTAIGRATTASGDYSTAIGVYNNPNIYGLFMVGNGSSSISPYTTFIIRKDNSRVGIGVENPLAPLHVANFGYVSTGQGHFFYYNTGLSTNPSYTANLGILADEGIVSKTYVGSAINVVTSDSRIKKDFSLSNNSEDLERLKKIQITNYRMKDVATWGTQTFKKVIAQQVEEVYPEVISKTKSVIPDIYALAESVVYDAQNKKLNVSLSKDYGIKIGDKIELVHPEKGKIQAEVVEVSGKSFTVKNWDYATDKIFVFGREVNDFRSVDYEALSMLGISAIQALAKEVEGLKKENIQLKSDFNKRLESIEASLRLTNQSTIK